MQKNEGKVTLEGYLQKASSRLCYKLVLFVTDKLKSVVVQVCSYSYQNVLGIMVADELLVPRTLLTIQGIN